MRIGRIGIIAGLLGLMLPAAAAGAESRLMATAQPAFADLLKERSPLTPMERQPYHAVRTLGALQERVAQGDETAFSLQKAVVSDIADELRAFPPEVWQNVRNREALIKYALSGGDPEMLRAVVAQKQFADTELPLAQAALAYAEGQRSVALRHLEKVDVYELPPSLAGHVALVKAIVIANADLTRVIRLCDDARLLSPGTLVEETALRLAIEATVAQRNRPKLEALALRYFRRFPRSPYLSAVIRPVAASIAENGYGERADGAKWVHSIVQFLDPNRLVQFYSTLAEVGLRSTKLPTAAHAARMAQKYARDGSAEHTAAQAYEGASIVIGPEGAKGLALLDAAEEAGVSAPVGELIASARAIARMIQAPPAPVLLPVSVLDAPPAADTAPPRSIKAPAAPKASADRSPGAARALARIAHVDKLLEDLDK